MILKAKLKLSNKSLAASLIPLLMATISSFAQGKGEQPVASPQNLHLWGAVTLFHGLPSNHVRAIAQSDEGVMWFGTDGGLVRYDGHHIQKAATEGLPAGRILALKFDLDGALWIGTSAGAARLTADGLSFIPETAEKAVTAIIAPERGRAVMASAEGMIFDCSIGADGSLAVKTIKPHQSALLYVDSNGREPLALTSLALMGDALIIGTRSRGLLSVARGEVKEILSSPRAFFIEAIETDPSGRLWFGAQTGSGDSGLYESGDLMRPTKSGANIGTVTAIKFDQTGGLWAGTDERGAFHYPEAGQSSAAPSRRVERFTFESTAGGMRSNRVYAIFIDREGVVWFGTDSGVCRYDPHGPLIETLSGNPESGFARALFQSSEGSLWCGTNSGLFVRDEKEAAWFPVKELAGKTVHSLAEDSTGRLLVGAAGGLYASALPHDGRRVRQRFARIDAERVDAVTGDSIRAICRFQGATYIASFGRGIERLDGSRRVLIWPLESGDERERQVVSLHADKDERLWISTGEAGVLVFDGKQVTPAPSSLKLDGDAAWAIGGQSDGGLWFGTSRGLYLFRSEELRGILEGIYVRGLAVSESGERSSLWCATVGGGLFQVLIDEGGEAIIAQINAEQGLPSESAFATLSTRSATGGETVWIGTSRGVVRYEPGRIAPSLRATRIMGKRMYQPNEMRAGLNLEYPQDSLALDVAAISSRTFPNQFQYSFSLFDGAGRMVMRKLGRDSQLVMENLRPGRYRVEALAYSKDLIASAPLAFEFTVAGAPFPWTSAALSVLLALALAAVWWGWRQNRRLAGTNYALGAANRQLGETRMQLANETETERRRISRDLHDQTLADLRRLLLLTDGLPPSRTGNGQPSITPAEFRGEIESIATEIRRICEDLSPSALANVGLTAALEWALSDAVAHLPPDKRFDYEFACEDNLEERLDLAPGVRIQIYRIAQEAISNICRHAGATRVRLSVAIEPTGDFVLRLEDDGRGFAVMKSATLSGRGLTNIRSRASLIEAEVAWHERPGGGILFTLRMPNADKATV